MPIFNQSNRALLDYDFISITPNPLHLDSRAQKYHNFLQEIGMTSLLISGGSRPEYWTISNLTNNKHFAFGKIKNIFLLKLRSFLRLIIRNSNILSLIFLPFLVFGYLMYIMILNMVLLKSIPTRVIIVHEPIYTLAAIRFKKQFQSKIIADVHDNYQLVSSQLDKFLFHRIFKNPLDEFMRKHLYKIADLRITVSEGLALELRKKYGVKFEVLSNNTEVFAKNTNLVPFSNQRGVTQKKTPLAGIFVGNNKNSLNMKFLRDHAYLLEKNNIFLDFFGHGYSDVLDANQSHSSLTFHNSIDLRSVQLDFNMYQFGFLPFNINDPTVKFALPNGFFLLANSGLPLLLPQNYEFEIINQTYQLGVLISFTDIFEFLDGVNILRNNSETFTKYRSHFLNDFSWKTEKNKFYKLISPLVT